MKFCGDFVKTERMKINRFYGVLKAEFREFITPSKCETLDELINLARDREIEIKRQEERGEKRLNEKGASSSPSKKGKYQEQGRKDKSTGGITPCKTCGELHTGECLLGKKGCYKCGKEGHSSYQCPNNPKTCFNCFERGHIKSECPKLQQESKKEDKKQEGSRAKGRMFQITSEEAKSQPNVVSCIFLLNSIPVYVLFDTGATMSFISNEIVQHPSFKVERMSMPLEVEISDSKNYLLHEICRSCKLTIKDEEFDIDLIPMILGEFKVIVGMDWMSQNHAEINCETKIILIQSPSGRRLNIQGERKVEAELCTLVQAIKYVLNGSMAYLAYVVDTQQGSPKLEDVEIVNEFPDVFPEELSGLPPEREVEFRIELNPGAKPVAKAPYRLAPTEMRELMTQLQDLLDKGFIRPKKFYNGITYDTKARSDTSAGGHLMGKKTVAERNDLFESFAQSEYEQWSAYRKSVPKMLSEHDLLLKNQQSALLNLQWSVDDIARQLQARPPGQFSGNTQPNPANHNVKAITTKSGLELGGLRDW
ncbi:uncharacterized protein LOC110919652 [Helianthus annuus]|uniref:uncharacterized protein LOC110919652 n=1 Tax=Helianthus annuus TaxID=4232 RepID=UPI000B8F4A10|nr:uncharacterized protein LOC110919652 [Helianthus annuus]